MQFGATLRLLRVDAGISLRGLAQRIGVSSAYLSRVENGHDSIPTPDRLAEIARVLGLPPAVLLELANKVEPLVSRYLEHVPAANALFLEIARRNLNGAQLARIQAFLDTEFPADSAYSRSLAPRLSTLLTPDRIIPQLSCTDFEDVLDLAATRLAEPGTGVGPARIVREMRRREEEASTAVGHGLAVPHALLPGIRPLAALVTLARPLPMLTPDNLPIRLLILLLDDSGGRRHLELLAQVARLASPTVVESLCQLNDADSLLEQLRQLELMYA